MGSPEEYVLKSWSVVDLGLSIELQLNCFLFPANALSWRLNQAKSTHFIESQLDIDDNQS